MKKGPIVHGGLLVVALVFAYQTWTRGDDETRKSGDVVVWKEAKGALTQVVYVKDKRTTRIERRGQGAEAYLWGVEQQTRPAPKKPTPPAPDEGGEGEPGDTGAEPPAEPDTIEVTNEFPIGKDGAEAFDRFAELRALRDLGKLGDDALAQYKLDDSKEQIEVTFGDRTRTLRVGGTVYAGSDRYVLEAETGRGYVISGEDLMPLLTGESRLRLKEVHAFDREALTAVRLVAGTHDERLIRTTVETDGPKGKVKTKTWARADRPNEPDQTRANFIDQLDKLGPTRYRTDLDPASMNRLVRLEYVGAGGAQVGWLELYRADSGDYYLQTSSTRVPGEVSKLAAERIDRDLGQIFEGAGSGQAPAEPPPAAPPAPAGPPAGAAPGAAPAADPPAAPVPRAPLPGHGHGH